MKKIVIFIIALLLISCSSDTVVYKFSTGASLGAYYPIGSAIAEILTDESDQYIVNAYTSSASVFNMEILADQSVDFAIVQSNVAYWGYEGVDMFENKIVNVNGIASLYSEYVLIIAREDSGIKMFEDLKGKRINIGKIGSGNYIDAVSILREHNISLDEIDVFTDDFVMSTERLLSGEIDSIIMTSGLPNDSILKLQSEVDLRFIEPDYDIMVQLARKNPYYVIEEIPLWSYTNLNETIKTLSVRALWVCNSELDNDLVYQMTKVFWENVLSLDDVHKNAEMIKILDARKGMSIPLHKGAKRYYEEQGMDPN